MAVTASRSREKTSRFWRSKKAAVIISYASIAAQTISTMVLTRLYLRWLGAELYGLYQMVYAVSQYILILDLGISTTMVRFIAQYDVEEDDEKRENFAFHFLLVVIGLAIVVGIVGIVIDVNLDTIYRNLNASESQLAHSMFEVMIWQLIITIVSHYLTGIVLARELYAPIRLLSVLEIVLNIILVVVFLVLGFGVLGIVYARTLVLLMQFTALFLLAFHYLGFKIQFHGWAWPMLIPAISLMFAMLLQSIVGYVNSSLDKTILGIMTTKTDVAVYSISAVFATMFNSLPTSISSVFATQTTRMVIGGSSGRELTDYIARVGRIQFMVIGGFLAGYCLFGIEFIRCWAGEEMSLAWLYGFIVMLPSMVPLVENTALSVLNAMDKRIFRSIILACMTLVNIGLTVFLVSAIGPMGAPIATGVSYILGHGIIMNVYYHKVIGFDVPRMFNSIINGTWKCILAVTLINVPLRLLDASHNWFILLVKGVVFCLTYAFVLYLWGMDAEEKALCNRLLRRLSIVQ